MAILSGGLCQITPAHSLNLVMDDSPPVNFVTPNGKFSGIAVDIITEAARASGVPIEINQFPWRRAYQMAQTEPNTCVFGTARLASRESLFRWVGPLTTGGVVLFGRLGRDYGVQSLDDVVRRGYVVSVEQDDVTHIALRDIPNIRLDIADEILGLRKLKINRVDLWAGGRLSGAYTARQEGVNDILAVLPVTTVEVMLACQLSSEETSLVKLQSGIELMRARGRIGEIEAKYLK